MKTVPNCPSCEGRGYAPKYGYEDDTVEAPVEANFYSDLELTKLRVQISEGTRLSAEMAGKRGYAISPRIKKANLP